MHLGVSKELLLSEMDSIMEILLKWRSRVDADWDTFRTTADEAAAYEWAHQLYGEVMLASDKCSALATRAVETAG